ncbi:MAG: family 78 glycoside hydrolase catalytic domain, partial [Victivallales bacterium]|nr:family 78 glycoside hydrolase catalytic domain [Victivallales bacterium]
MDMILMASLIWLGEQVAPVDSYYRFRKTFQLKSTEKTELRISADSDYVVYINGKRMSVTQFPDFPDRKTFSTIDISDEVKKGDNSIAVLVHHIGQSFFTHYKCDPGLMAVVSQDGKPVIVTDGTWKCSVDPCFAQNRRVIVSPQLGFTFEYDARKEDKWMEIDYDDSGWESATVHQRPTANGHWASLEQRPIAQLADGTPQDVTMVWQGWTMKSGGVPFFGSRFVQEAFDVPESERAGVNRKKPMLKLGGPVWRFKKPPQADMGVALTVDFGRESTGYMTFIVEAAEGTVLEIHHGEHLDDGHPRSV